MALPVTFKNGHYQTLLACRRGKGGFASDPVLGIVSGLGLHGVFHTILRYYVGVLAGTI